MPNSQPLTPQVEYREVEEIQCEEETRDDGTQERAISGYAATFNKMSLDLGGFKEKIQPGAFANSINRDVVALWSHNSDIVLGRSSNDTLKIEEDEKGLKFRLALDDDAWGQYAYKKIKRKDVRGMSFGFRVLEDAWDFNEKKEYIRTLVKVSLVEVSPTAFPAYPSTSVSARSIEDVLKHGREAVGIPVVNLSSYYRSLNLRLIESCIKG
jgi:HK97 family phage prohead protease